MIWGVGAEGERERDTYRQKEGEKGWGGQKREKRGGDGRQMMLR